MGQESTEQGPCIGATTEGKEEGTRTNLIQEHGEGAEPHREGSHRPSEAALSSATSWDPGAPVCTRPRGPPPAAAGWGASQGGHGPYGGTGEDRGLLCAGLSDGGGKKERCL